MAKPDKLNIIWASDVGAGVTDPGDVKYTLGWEAEIPPYQYFNYILNKHSAMLDHVNTYGIPEYDLLTEYKLGSKVLHLGIEYTCKVASSIGEVPTDLVDWDNTESDQPTKTTNDVTFNSVTSNGVTLTGTIWEATDSEADAYAKLVAIVGDQGSGSCIGRAGTSTILRVVHNGVVVSIYDVGGAGTSITNSGVPIGYAGNLMLVT